MPTAITDKLRRLTEGTNKADVARRAGLKPTQLNDYTNKGYLPRYDIAFRIAKALRVQLDWLLDDSQDWPPPVLDDDRLWLASDHDILREFCTRFRRLCVRLYDDLNRAESTDWVAVAKSLAAMPVDQQLPPQLGADARLPNTLVALTNDLSALDPSIASIGLHNELPGREIDPESLTEMRLLERWRMLLEKAPGFGQVLTLYALRFMPRDEPQRELRVSETLRRINGELAALGSKSHRRITHKAGS